ncbi:MAG: Rne/Rng family ribonuclease [Alphaproteobacteria bacterium]|nr:Rne/Rng family ribonuclease [Alphaproteobacteria bacterium]
MAKKLLIDANHPEEIRVAVVNGPLLEEFDSETSTKKQIKGNIYLAKVIRVEPSLQAAFVDFGGNRHGFLSFSEIHPDYYRIPVADREKVLKTVQSETLKEHLEGSEQFPLESDVEENSSENLKELTEEQLLENAASAQSEESNDDHSHDDHDEEKSAEPAKKPKEYRYKIQEVIKRRQIMLVQVVKEERGNKGAALTTYLSLPGRYCVLMPNAGYRAGGVSRKINDGDDRRRLRDLVKELNIPDGMALIVRTAGQERNKIEIRRDYDYLLRLWNDIRELTLQSIAPFLVYAEGDLIKRSIRDIYDRDVDQILVEGEEAYKAAKAFMRMLIPSHARKVQPYKDENVPLFHKFRIEEQLQNIMHPAVRLTSGGSIVINPTEALVAIDVNSGKATRERHIDDTALKTNLEAADEIARQMRLRDLAGLIVIDFIDMNDQNHIQQVEKRLRDATKHDRARLQVGRISQFGLMELSRQRLRPSILETYTTSCSHCNGTGLVRSTESTALHVLRAIETEAIQGKLKEILVTVPSGIDLYLLNQKRTSILLIESRFGISIQITRDDSLNSPDFKIDVLAAKDDLVIEAKPILQSQPQLEDAEEKEDRSSPASDEESAENRSRRNRNRRQRQRRGPGHTSPHQNQDGDKEIVAESLQSEPPSQQPVKAQEEIIGEDGNPVRQNKRRSRNRFRRRGPRPPQSNEQRSNEERPRTNEVHGERAKEQKEAIVHPLRVHTPSSETKTERSSDDAKPKRKPKGWLRRLLD